LHNAAKLSDGLSASSKIYTSSHIHYNRRRQKVIYQAELTIRIIMVCVINTICAWIKPVQFITLAKLMYKRVATIHREFRHTEIATK